MFKNIILLLLSGEFLCNVSRPDEFSFLQDEATRLDVDAYLARIGRRLGLTRNGVAFYAAHASIGAEERTEARIVFKEIKRDLRPIVKFLNLVMQAQRSDMTLFAGDSLRYHELLTRIRESSHLTDELSSFAKLGNEYASSSETVPGILDKILQRLAKNGYLVADRERDRYTLTGKIDYLQEVIDFLLENEEEIVQTSQEAPEQESLL
jgi:biotin operon repressor